MDRLKRIWYLSPMRAAKAQASLRIRAVSPEPLLLAHTSGESRGAFRQKAKSLAPLNGLACAVKICHDGMLEDTNSLDGAQIMIFNTTCLTFSFQDRRVFKQMPRFRSRSQFNTYETTVPEEPDISEYCVDIICVVDYSIFKK